MNGALCTEISRCVRERVCARSDRCATSLARVVLSPFHIVNNVRCPELQQAGRGGLGCSGLYGRFTRVTAIIVALGCFRCYCCTEDGILARIAGSVFFYCIPGTKQQFPWGTRVEGFDTSELQSFANDFPPCCIFLQCRLFVQRNVPPFVLACVYIYPRNWCCTYELLPDPLARSTVKQAVPGAGASTELGLCLMRCFEKRPFPPSARLS